MSRFFFDWTPRRQEIVRRGMAEGTQQKDIAAALGCSPDTLRRHLNSKAPKGTGNGA